MERYIADEHGGDTVVSGRETGSDRRERSVEVRERDGRIEVKARG